METIRHRKCDVRCQRAKSKKCSCQCGGENHGKGIIHDSLVDAEHVHPRHRPKANYSIVQDKPGAPLLIKDEGPWDKFMTVTNAAEFVVQELKKKLPAGRRLLYWDSNGTLDEILVKDGKFSGFKAFKPEPDIF